MEEKLRQKPVTKNKHFSQKFEFSPLYVWIIEWSSRFWSAVSTKLCFETTKLNIRWIFSYFRKNEEEVEMKENSTHFFRCSSSSAWMILFFLASACNLTILQWTQIIESKDRWEWWMFKKSPSVFPIFDSPCLHPTFLFQQLSFDLFINRPRLFKFFGFGRGLHHRANFLQLRHLCDIYPRWSRFRRENTLKVWKQQANCNHSTRRKTAWEMMSVWFDHAKTNIEQCEEQDAG